MGKDESLDGFLMKNFFVYVDTCHESCASCNGPDYVNNLF